MTVVKNCATLEEAWLVKNQLENGGIEADVLDEAVASAAPHLLNATGIRVAVADEDAAAARELLDLPPMENRNIPTARRKTPVWLVAGIAAIAIASLFAMGNRTHAASGDSHIQNIDRNGDGKPDERLEYGENGKLRHAWLDENFDGVWDYRSDSDENGLIVKCERDLDFDGTFDMVETFKNGILQTKTITPGGIGNPLFRYDYKDGVLEKRWEDPDRHGAWSTSTTYDAMGREVDHRTYK